MMFTLMVIVFGLGSTQPTTVSVTPELSQQSCDLTLELISYELSMRDREFEAACIYAEGD